MLDGFPRNAAQAEFFLETYDIDAVIAIELPEEAAIARMQSRRLCASCGLDYNLIQLRPKVVDVCDNCGGRLVTRADDTPEADPQRACGTTARRPSRSSTSSREKEMIVTVDGTPAPDVVQAEMRRKLGLMPVPVETDRPGAGRRRLRRGVSETKPVPAPPEPVVLDLEWLGDNRLRGRSGASRS